MVAFSKNNIYIYITDEEWKEDERKEGNNQRLEWGLVDDEMWEKGRWVDEGWELLDRWSWGVESEEKDCEQA